MKRKDCKVGDKVIVNKLSYETGVFGVGDLVTLTELDCEETAYAVTGDGEKVIIRYKNVTLYSREQSKTIKSMIEKGKSFCIKTDNNNNDLCDYIESLGISIWLKTMNERTTANYICIDLEDGNKDYLQCYSVGSYADLLEPRHYKQELEDFMSTKHNKKADLSFNSQQEIWEWLVDGGEVISNITKSIFKFNEDNELINCSGGGISSFELIGLYKKHIELEPTKWHENIGKGRLCRVADGGELIIRIALIVSHNTEELHKFKDNNGCRWQRAEPLTRAEVLEYLEGVE